MQNVQISRLGRCSYQQHSSEGEVGRQRGEKRMDTRGRSAWWRRTWSRVDQHQTVCQSQMGGQQGAGVHGGEGVRVQGGTGRRRRKRRRGSGDGARGQQRVGMGMGTRGRAEWCEGAGGHEETQAQAAAWEWGRSTWEAAGGGGDRWVGCGVFTHNVLHIHHGTHPHQGVDQS